MVYSICLKLVDRGHEKKFIKGDISFNRHFRKYSVEICEQYVKSRKTRRESGLPKYIALWNEDLICRKMYQVYEEQKDHTISRTQAIRGRL